MNHPFLFTNQNELEVFYELEGKLSNTNMASLELRLPVLAERATAHKHSLGNFACFIGPKTV
jgi:hypothetical protein